MVNPLSILRFVFSKFPIGFRLRISFLLDKLRLFLIGEYAIGILVDSWNGNLIVPASDHIIGRALAKNGEWDKEHIDELAKIIKSDSTVLFVGTHIGSLMIPIAKRVKKVVGIEANPNTFKFLEANLFINKISNFEIFNYAAGEKEGDIQFLMSKHNTGGSKIMPHRKGVKEFVYDQPDVVTVPMKALDEEFPTSMFDVIVMDIEGAEYFALKGMPKILKSAKHIQCEIILNHLEKVSNVSFHKFIEIFEKSFDIALIQFPNGKTRSISKSDFGNIDNILKEELNAENNKRIIIGADVIFSKV